MIIPLISLDTETTGLEPAVNAPWEIAWTTALHDVQAGTLTLIRSQSLMLVLPDGAILDSVALRISKYAQRWHMQGDPIGQNHAAITSLIIDCRDIYDSQNAYPSFEVWTPVHMIGAVPQFDHRMLERWLGWSHRTWHYHLIDVETLLAGALKIPPPFDTDDLTDRAMEILGVVWDDSRKHEAAHDVRWNLHLYAAAYGLKLVES